MKVTKTELEGVLIIEPEVFGDRRGFFKESFHAERYAKFGIKAQFVQDNYSRSKAGVLRGMHLQQRRPQGKLVSCPNGAIFDVAVDVDPRSPSFGKYVAVELTGSNHKQLWIPPGYAHGFCVLSEMADLHYKCTDIYCPDDQSGFVWNDPDVAIPWPIKDPQLSEKDDTLPTLARLISGKENQ